MLTNGFTCRDAEDDRIAEEDALRPLTVPSPPPPPLFGELVRLGRRLLLWLRLLFDDAERRTAPAEDAPPRVADADRDWGWDWGGGVGVFRDDDDNVDVAGCAVDDNDDFAAAAVFGIAAGEAGRRRIAEEEGV